VTTFPLPGTQVQRWYLGAGGTLRTTVPTTAGTDAYVSDPAARPKALAHSRGIWSADPGFQWTQPVAGKALSYLSPALTQEAVMAGTGSVDLWLRSSAADTDLQVTLTEVRPDGKEVRVQSGWLRASVRKLDTARSTALQPLPTMVEADAAPLPAGAFTPVRVQIYPFAHTFRAGSRIRVVLSAPGGDQNPWTFDTLPGTQTNEVARSVDRPSSLALPLVSGIDAPDAYPACPGLRQQPCRTYQALAP
jgi:putative CocE/NonD family hydrolase